MFNLKEYIVKNIINGVKNGTWSKEYAGIMAVNYLVKGILTEEDIANIDSQITAWEEEKASTNVNVPDETIVLDEPVAEEPDGDEEVTEPEETTEPEEEPAESVTEEPETNEPEETENEMVSEENEPENTETETEIEESEPVE